MKVAAVIPVGPGRLENLIEVLASLRSQTRLPDAVVIVEDGPALDGVSFQGLDLATSLIVHTAKHEPGMEQPRNIGTRVAEAVWGVDHVWFLDSDVVVDTDCLEELETALERGPQDRIVVAPYDWLAPGLRPTSQGRVPPEWYGWNNDPRWEQFRASPPERVYNADLGAALACFSGNLLWPVSEFKRVGGFWNELHHGRCEDGELGLRAAAMGVGISFASAARGWHLWHPVNHELAVARNARDVPMLNDRHPWVQGAGVILTDRDGAAFDVRCRCEQTIATIGWWDHAADCPATSLEIPVALP